MFKVINDKQVSINNFEFIKEAFRGKTNVPKHSNITKVYDFLDLNLVKDCISCYYKVHEKLLFPLCSFEEPIRYNAVAICMKQIAIEDGLDEFIELLESEDVVINVSRGLTVMINDMQGVEFIGDSWRIIDADCGLSNNLKDIEEYKDTLGYEEYKWVIEKLSKSQTLESYYMKFMSDLWEACNYKLSDVVKEMKYILKLDNYIERLDCNDYQFLDLDNDYIHYMMLTNKGKAIIHDDRIRAVRIDGNKMTNLGTRGRTVNYFDYELITLDKEGKPINYGRITGLDVIMQMIVAKYNINIHKAKVKGYLYKRYIVFELDYSVYVCLRDEQNDNYMLIDNNSKIINIEEDFIYTKKMSKGCVEVYKDNLISGETYLCSIEYTN